MNNKVTCRFFFSFRMNLLIFNIFFFVFENIDFKKNLSNNREIVNFITRKILVCGVESYYKKIHKDRNITLIFQKLEKN